MQQITQKNDGNENPSRICYLDFDGCLHDDSVFWSPKKGIYIKTPGRALFEWEHILEELLAPHPDVKIVLSTSWVRVRSFNYAKNQLSKSLQSRVIGATFHRQYMRGDDFSLLPRGVQIAEDVSRREPNAWFAIDDDHHGWPEWCRDKLIQTDGAVGLSDRHIQESIRIMLEKF